MEPDRVPGCEGGFGAAPFVSKLMSFVFSSESRRLPPLGFLISMGGAGAAAAWMGDVRAGGSTGATATGCTGICIGCGGMAGGMWAVMG